MIPLIFLALALSAVAVGYGISPRAREWIDDHARAIRGALEAHHAAEAHLSAARAATDPVVAVQHAHAASTANRVAAQETAVAAMAARNDQQRGTAAQSADTVVVREEKITATLADIGVGQCDIRSYSHVTPQLRDTLLARLHSEGMAVTGGNPWDIDTNQFGVKLRAVWDPQTQVLKIIATAGKGGWGGLVTCSEIWAKVDPIMKEIVGT